MIWRYALISPSSNAISLKFHLSISQRKSTFELYHIGNIFKELWSCRNLLDSVKFLIMSPWNHHVVLCPGSLLVFYPSRLRIQDFYSVKWKASKLLWKSYQGFVSSILRIIRKDRVLMDFGDIPKIWGLKW